MVYKGKAIFIPDIDKTLENSGEHLYIVMHDPIYSLPATASTGNSANHLDIVFMISIRTAKPDEHKRPDCIEPCGVGDPLYHSFIKRKSVPSYKYRKIEWVEDIEKSIAIGKYREHQDIMPEGILEIIKKGFKLKKNYRHLTPVAKKLLDL